MTRLSHAWALILFTSLSMLASPAVAQLDAARRYLADADFQRAERAFGRALGAPALSRDELTSIFEGRAVARWALGDEDEARADLVALGSLDPDHTLPPEAPPLLVETFAALPREPLVIALTWAETREGETTLRAAVDNDLAALVRTVRIHVRRQGDPEWTTSVEPEVAIRMHPGDVVEAWVEALGPGGAVVAHQGSALAPIEHGHDLVAASEGGTSSRAPDHDTTWIWVGVGAGVAVVVAAIVVGVAVGTASSDATQPSAPMVIGF